MIAAVPVGRLISATKMRSEIAEIMPGIEPGRDIIDASKGRVRVANDATTMPAALLSEAPMELAL